MKYGLIGEKLSHSSSPLIHSLFNNDEYVLKEISEKDIESFVKSRDYLGLNVTIPYKKTVIPFLDEIDEKTREIGSINTIINRSGKLIGYNTDIFGMKSAMDSAGIVLKDKKVLILGSGGTSNTAKRLAKDEQASEIVIVSRNGKVNYDNIYEQKDAEVLINTTPVGMYPNNGNSLIDINRLKKLCGVFDAVYNPVNSKLILDAKMNNIKACGGLKMLIEQARKTEELFFDKTIIDEASEAVFYKLKYDSENIVLIGMPGCGKTLIGKLLSEKLNRDFIDIDAEIEKNAGMSIPLIFSKYGEEYFRKLESEAVYNVGKLKGKVISTGGGIVKTEANYYSIKQNSFVIRINRDLEKLESKDRPVSLSTNIYKLAEEREELYKKFADVEINNDKTPETTVSNLIKEIKRRYGIENLNY